MLRGGWGEARPEGQKGRLRRRKRRAPGIMESVISQLYHLRELLQDIGFSLPPIHDRIDAQYCPDVRNIMHALIEQERALAELIKRLDAASLDERPST